MKHLFIILLLFSLYSCDKDVAETNNFQEIEPIPADWISITLDNSDSLMVPDSFELVRIADSEMHSGILLSGDIEIFFEFGLAGIPYFVYQENCHPSINSEFCYAIFEDEIRTTFADAGPAYFEARVENKDLFLQIMSSFTDN